MDLDQMIEVLQAAKAGKKIQFKGKRRLPDQWSNVKGLLVWQFGDYDYRVAPEPMEIWLPKVKDGYASKEECEAMWPRHKAVLFREVL